MADDNLPTFRTGAVRPTECFRAAWELIKDNYWLFLGITFVGTLIAQLTPFGILAGPMMCGIFLCLFRQADGRAVKFEHLFKGFDYFVQSLIATLLMMVPLLAVVVIGMVALFAVLFATGPGGGGKPSGPPTAFLLSYAAFWVVLLAAIFVLSVFFMFVYPLIVDRKLSGVEALKTSLRASRANLGGVIGLVLINFLLNIVGELACCVGQIFVLPVHFAAIAVAYRAVFPDEDAAPMPRSGEELDYDDQLELEPPPPEPPKDVP